MKRLVKVITIVLPVIVLLGLIIRTKMDKEGMVKIGNTIVLINDYDKKTELSSGEIQHYETEVKKYDDLITNRGGSGSGIIQSTGIIGATQGKAIPQMDRFIMKAENLRLLGRYTDAIKALHDAYRRYSPDSQIREPLARLYEGLEEYELAISYYQKILNLHPEFKQQIMLKLITLYIAEGDGETAGKRYFQYIIKEGGIKQPDIEKEIQQLNFPSKETK